MTLKQKEKSNNKQVSQMIDDLVTKGNKALEKMKQLDQATIDIIVNEMALAGLDQHMALAKLAIEETKRGVYEDKIIKNIFATEYIHNNIKYNKTVGVIEENELDVIVSISEPVGVVCGITPVTNSTGSAILTIPFSSFSSITA